MKSEFRKKIASYFDLLDNLAQLDPEILLQQFTPEIVEALSALTPILIDERLNLDELETEELVSLVQRLRTMKRTGSRQLGEALIEAAKYAKEENFALALNLLQNFAATCPSSFYREQAAGYMLHYERQAKGTDK